VCAYLHISVCARAVSVCVCVVCGVCVCVCVFVCVSVCECLRVHHNINVLTMNVHILVPGVLVIHTNRSLCLHTSDEFLCLSSEFVVVLLNLRCRRTGENMYTNM
jgi:hypothetical protein